MFSDQSPLRPEVHLALDRLPPMPEITRRLFVLRNDPDAAVGDLAEIVALDPALAAQVMRYAQSPLFNYRGRLDSVEEAIVRVLGFDMVLNMALGLSVRRSFPLPDQGPIGRLSFWRHAVYSAALAQGIAKVIPAELRPTPGTAYLLGLLHNIGLLVLGQLAPRDYRQLNACLETDPAADIGDCERSLCDGSDDPAWLQAGHAVLGGELLSVWGFSGDLIVAAREHHNPHYHGEHAVCAHLALLVDRLLAQIDMMCDVRQDHLPFSSLSTLSVTADQVAAVVQGVVDGSWELDSMGRQLAA